MFVFDVDDFNGWIGTNPSDDVNGGGSLPTSMRGYIGFAIGPESTCDRVRIDGVPLIVGAVLPFTRRDKAKLDPMRGRPTGVTNGRGSDLNGHLQLLCYECGDAFVAPGPRLSHLASDIRDLSAAYVRVLRAPFSGRRWGRLSFWTESSTDQPVQWIAEGIIYQPRGIDSNNATRAEDPARVQLDAQTFTPAALTSDGGTRQAAYYLGGTDSAESFDEIWIWARLAAEAAQNVTTYFESYDTPVR